MWKHTITKVIIDLMMILTIVIIIIVIIITQMIMDINATIKPYLIKSIYKVIIYFSNKYSLSVNFSPIFLKDNTNFLSNFTCLTISPARCSSREVIMTGLSKLKLDILSKSRPSTDATSKIDGR